MLLICPSALLVCISLWLFISVSSLLLFLHCWHPIWDSVSHCFNILSRGSSVCWVSLSLRYYSGVMDLFWCVDCFYPYCVGYIVMVMVASTNHCPIGPWSTMLSLSCYSRPCWKLTIISGSIIFLVILCFSLYYCFIMLIIIIQINLVAY